MSSIIRRTTWPPIVWARWDYLEVPCGCVEIGRVVSPMRFVPDLGLFVLLGWGGWDGGDEDVVWSIWDGVFELGAMRSEVPSPFLPATIHFLISCARVYSDRRRRRRAARLCLLLPPRRTASSRLTCLLTINHNQMCTYNFTSSSCLARCCIMISNPNSRNEILFLDSLWRAVV